jgi:hypothetical protein
MAADMIFVCFLLKHLSWVALRVEESARSAVQKADDHIELNGVAGDDCFLCLS